MSELIGQPISLNVAVEQRLFSLIRDGILVVRSELFIAIEDIFRSEEARIFYAMDGSIVSKIKESFSEIKESFKKVTSKYYSMAREFIIKYSKLAVSNSLKSMVNISKLNEKPVDFKETVVSLSETTQLFESVVDKLVDDVEANVYRVISENSYNSDQAKSDISVDIENRVLRSVKHAANISKCQTNKTFNISSREILQSRGIRKFKWIYTYRSHTERIFHEKVLKNKIFDFDNPPIIELSTKIRGYPGQLPNCKCKMSPVIDI